MGNKYDTFSVMLVDREKSIGPILNCRVTLPAVSLGQILSLNTTDTDGNIVSGLFEVYAVTYPADGGNVLKVTRTTNE